MPKRKLHFILGMYTVLSLIGEQEWHSEGEPPPPEPTNVWSGLESRRRRHQGLCLLFVFPFAPRDFSLGTPIFRSPKKPTFPNSNSTRMTEEEPVWMCHLLPQMINIYLLIYLFIYLQFLCQLPVNVIGTVIRVLISMINVHPTGNVAHRTTTTAHLQLTTVVAARSSSSSLFYSFHF